MFLALFDSKYHINDYYGSEKTISARGRFNLNEMRKRFSGEWRFYDKNEYEHPLLKPLIESPLLGDGSLYGLNSLHKNMIVVEFMDDNDSMLVKMNPVSFLRKSREYGTRYIGTIGPISDISATIKSITDLTDKIESIDSSISQISSAQTILESTVYGRMILSNNLIEKRPFGTSEIDVDTVVDDARRILCSTQHSISTSISNLQQTNLYIKRLLTQMQELRALHKEEYEKKMSFLLNLSFTQ